MSKSSKKKEKKTQNGSCFPDWRIPLLIQAAENTDSGNDSNVFQFSHDNEGNVFGSETNIGEDDRRMVDVSSGLGRFRSCREKVSQVLIQFLNNPSCEQEADHNKIVESVVEALMSYVVLLQTARQEIHAFLSSSSSFGHNDDGLFFTWRWKDTNHDDPKTFDPPSPSDNNKPQSPGNKSFPGLWHSIWDWELNHVYWNLALVESYKALILITIPPGSKQEEEEADDEAINRRRTAWKQAGTNWQTAAAWIQYPTLPSKQNPPLNNNNNHDEDPIVSMWQYYCIAQAQFAAYQYLNMAPRPSHVMLAKAAAGAVPLFQRAAEAANLCQSWSLPAQFCNAHHMCFSALAEFHQASTTLNNPQQSITAHARLIKRAWPLACVAQEFLQSLFEQHGKDIEALLPLKQLWQQHWPSIEQWHQHISLDGPHDLLEVELPDICPQTLVKVQPQQVVPAALAKHKIATTPIFPIVHHQRFIFRRLQVILQQTTSMAENITEQARNTLAKVDLPNALVNAVQQNDRNNSDANGHDESNLPSFRSKALWQRVERIQRGESDNKENTCLGLNELQQGLWELRDHAEQAHSVLQQIQDQLEENVSLDQEFTKLYTDYQPKFCVSEVQALFWNSLKKYQQLLHSASTGDRVLFGRLESLPTDPNFQLLSKLTWAKIERLVVSARSPPTAAPSQALTKSMECLNRGLTELSSLFQKREELVQVQLPQEIQLAFQQASQTLLAQLQEQGTTPSSSPSSDRLPTSEKKTFSRMEQGTIDNSPVDDKSEVQRQNILKTAQAAIRPCLDEIQSNINQQTVLLKSILQENQTFSQLTASSSVARAASATESTAERTLGMLEEALVEMEQLQNHWQQGRVFYQGVIPKLQKLQQQVSEVSTRMAVDRCEYLDEMARVQQEAKDAAMAAAMANQQDEEDNNRKDVDKAENIHPHKDDNNETHSSLTNSDPLHSQHGNDDEDLKPESRSREDDRNGGKSESSDVEDLSEEGPASRRREQRRRLSGNGSCSSLSSRNSNSIANSLVQHIRHDDYLSTVQVDDEKVAMLVAMDFDFELVIAALKKFDNHVELALNDLLATTSS